MTRAMDRRVFLWQVATMGGVTLGAAASVAAQSPVPRRTPSGDLLETVPPGELPAFAKGGNARVAEAYRYAAANGNTLQYIPCFCGCKNIGHRHNGDCYVTERHRDGRITFNSHSAT